jgi:FixJ family two-component response regulator
MVMATALHSTVFVVDDDASVRRGFARLLGSAGYAVETFASPRFFLDRARNDDICGCVLLDVQMPELTGLDLQAQLKALAPTLPILFVTGHGDVPTSVRAMKDGAIDFLTKPVDNKDLLSAVEQGLARNLEARARDAELQELRRRAATLTPREREVMELVVQGKLNKQIASDLGTVEKTVKVHRARVIQKMGVLSLAELVRDAEKLGIFHEKQNFASSRATRVIVTPFASA